VPARWFAGNSSTPEERHTANESEMVSDYQEYVDDTMPLPADVEREFMEKGHDQVSAIAWLAELEIDPEPVLEAAGRLGAFDLRTVPRMNADFFGGQFETYRR
jgi:hypothetical protein